jgi:hypothetical protein
LIFSDGSPLAVIDAIETRRLERDRQVRALQHESKMANPTRGVIDVLDREIELV